VCKTEEEAHYIASLINSAIFQFAVTSYSQAGGKSMGSMHVLQNIRIPKFDTADKVHLEIEKALRRSHHPQKVAFLDQFLGADHYHTDSKGLKNGYKRLDKFSRKR